MGVNASKCKQDFVDKAERTRRNAASVLAEYEASYLHADFCSRVAAFEERSEQVVTLPEMQNAAQTLGVAVTDADTVKRICSKIRDHFLRRKQLIEYQLGTVSLAESWLDQVTTGEYCAPESMYD
jgi:hypothetical protein